jgi:multicomponent Na+:H+ antiporter subunit D
MRSLVIPILVPFFTAIILALLHGRPRAEKIISLISSLGLTAWVFWLTWYVDTHGMQMVVMGGWEAPFGIPFVADRLACIMLCLSTAVGTLALIYTFSTVTPIQQKHFFYPFLQIVLLGVNWAFLTGDLFNLFVAYEVMLVGSYGMMLVGASRAQLRETMKYIAINTVGSTLFVAAIGFIYATTGTLNMADLAHQTANLQGNQAAMVTAASMVLLVVFATKAAAFPLFFWLPDSYPIVPPGMNGYFAGLLTKVGIYSLLRVFVMVFRQPGSEFALQTLLVLSGFTMVLGVMGAMCQWEIRRILSWHIISQVGYMVMGIGMVGIATDDPELNMAVRRMAVAGTIFYVVHHIVVKSCLFLVGGIAEKVSGTQQLKKMGGVLELSPVTAGLFLVAAFSLAGMPPFSGFLAKFVLIRAGLTGGGTLFTIIIVAAIVTSFLTLFSMSKIWSYGFWRNRCRETSQARIWPMVTPTLVLVLFTIGMGLWAQPFLALSNRAADSLINPQDYIALVMPEHSARPGSSVETRQADVSTSADHAPAAIAEVSEDHP